MTKTEYIDKLREMVYDINSAEIASHIENDSLRQWIYVWHHEICNRIHMINLIKEIPSAEPKEGHWILQPSNKEQGERDFIWWKCSECGQVIYSETEKDRREYHVFCGRCGARMFEPQESEEV